ncbi:MAG: deoxyribodipyrimidine photolyase [Planctomycetota bacterium]|nr:deoxyribodipyrimidine photolyase [Planctomycetota bacterium]MDA1180111.1 deoxyribodipyrimidine photolyase [Planctomycetota bacterium]
MVPISRIRICNNAPIRGEGEFVLYWMIAFRRMSSNFSLQRAVELAKELKKPLVIFEPLRIGYRWASDRIHRFVIDGMAENASRVDALNNPGVRYFPYVELRHDADKGLLTAMAERACVVITDDFPSFFLPRMVSAAASRLPVRLESIDSNGLLPLRATDRVFTTAFSFRAFLQKQLPPYLEEVPEPNPFQGVRLPPLKSMPPEITQRWPAVSAKLLAGDRAELAALPIDHSVGIVEARGGSKVARERLKTFLDQHLPHYAAGANDPDADNRSGLSPYLHFGHISSHELFHEVALREEWSPTSLGHKTGGKREGWWGMSPGAESWLDEFVTWRELGYNMTSHRDDYDQFESLPGWAQATLTKHESDPRQFVYSLGEFTAGATHDPLWNAAQNQLVREGRIHNYLRMLWGKKILEWTPTPRDALSVMIELNNRYALDGRNPNSYSGIFWVLGRYDRAWGPERPIFGNIRYMSSDNTRKKVNVREYLKMYSWG